MQEVQRAGNPKRGGRPESVIGSEVRRLAVSAGLAVRSERTRRRLTVRDLAELAGLGASTVHAAEAGRPASLETYVRLAGALRLRPELEIRDPRRREPRTLRAEDPVHAAMGEAQAARLRCRGFQVGLDEPYQHYQHAGRADLVAWSADLAALLHIENRTRFPNIQEAFGSFNAKRAYLGPELAARAGLQRWRSETHVIAALWSAEASQAIRLHRASFESVCPDAGGGFEDWWRGEPPASGRRSILILFGGDAATGPGGRGWRTWIGCGRDTAATPKRWLLCGWARTPRARAPRARPPEWTQRHPRRESPDGRPGSPRR